jgi:hypothetical protein
VRVAKIPRFAAGARWAADLACPVPIVDPAVDSLVPPAPTRPGSLTDVRALCTPAVVSVRLPAMRPIRAVGARPPVFARKAACWVRLRAAATTGDSASVLVCCANFCFVRLDY